MPYTRPYRRFYLTPPAVPTFVISALLAIAAVLVVYGHFTVLHGVSAFLILLIAYVVLQLGNLLRGSRSYQSLGRRACRAVRQPSHATRNGDRALPSTDVIDSASLAG